MSRCFIVQPIHELGLARLREAGLEPVMASSADQAVVAREVGEAVAVITRDAGFSAAAMDAAPRLRIIANHGIGTNKVAVDHAESLGITVCNTPYANARSVAEHTIGLILAVARRLLEGDAAVRGNNWGFRYAGGMAELYGKTLGLVGFGKIAQMTAAIAKNGFGMKIVVFSPQAPDAALAEIGAERCESLPALLGRADVVSLHRPLRPDTANCIDAAALAAMKPSAILVNTARGGLIDHDALLEALRAKRIAGAALDVFPVEPPPAEDALYALPNVVLAPHLGGATEDALRIMALECAEMVIDALAGRKPANLLRESLWEKRRA